MAELSSWPTQNSGPTGTIDSREAATHIGALVYPHTSILKAKSGFRPGPGSSPGLVTATGTPDGFVHVAPFELLMQNIRGSGLGTYIAGLDAIKDINILSTPADPTNPRDDLIVAQQSDLFDGDANSDFLVRHVVGTPAGVPADPAISGSTNVVALARVRVNANATTISGSNITDLRTTGHAKSLVAGLHSVALGGLLPVASAAERDALTGIYNGLPVWRQDLKQIEVSDGSAWGALPNQEAVNAWVSWTPTLTNLTLGNGTVTAKRRLVGKTVDYRFEFVLGSTSAVGTDPKFTLPSAPHADYSQFEVVGRGTLLDSGTASTDSIGRFDTGSTVIIMHQAASNLHASITATVPWTWTTNDMLTVHGTFEVA